MHMTELIRFVAVEIKPVWATSQDGRHAPILPDCDSVRTGIHYVRNSDPCGLTEKQPTAPGAMSRETLGTQGPGGNARASRDWKGAFSPEMCPFPDGPRFQSESGFSFAHDSSRQ